MHGPITIRLSNYVKSSVYLICDLLANVADKVKSTWNVKREIWWICAHGGVSLMAFVRVHDELCWDKLAVLIQGC